MKSGCRLNRLSDHSNDVWHRQHDYQQLMWTLVCFIPSKTGPLTLPTWICTCCHQCKCSHFFIFLCTLSSSSSHSHLEATQHDLSAMTVWSQQKCPPSPSQLAVTTQSTCVSSELIVINDSSFWSSTGAIHCWFPQLFHQLFNDGCGECCSTRESKISFYC